MKSNLGVGVMLIALHAASASAEGDPLGADEIAETIVRMTSRVWTGPRTPVPTSVDRPTEAKLIPLRSGTAMVAVHAAPHVDHDTHARVLRALEDARGRLDALGWPLPISDGELGGGAEFDLYLTSSIPSGGHSDGLVPWTYLDRASTFGVLAAPPPDERLDACVIEAYANAMLLGADPAEASEWRRATAAWLAWELTGDFGCGDPVRAQQAEPFRSWVRDAAEAGAGGALLLAYLSVRHDRDSSAFMRDVWTLASQRTWEGEGLRAEPDLWSAIETAVELSGDRLLDNMEELAVLRWFVGRAGAGQTLAAELDTDARISATRRMTRLPSRISARTPLRPFGSAYVTMANAAWGEATRLRTWLRGEYGVRWSLIVLQLDAHGSEVSRMSAPETGATPEAYLPIELHPTTTELLFVVTHLANELPDADEPDASERAFELIVDRAE